MKEMFTLLPMTFVLPKEFLAFAEAFGKGGQCVPVFHSVYLYIHRRSMVSLFAVAIPPEEGGGGGAYS